MDKPTKVPCRPILPGGGQFAERIGKITHGDATALPKGRDCFMESAPPKSAAYPPPYSEDAYPPGQSEPVVFLGSRLIRGRRYLPPADK